MWCPGGSPQSLLNAVFFYNGIHFCLHGEEHRKLKLEQITRDRTGYTYHENGSKNQKGTFRERNICNKVVHSYAVPEAGERCHVHLLDVYISKLPKNAHSMEAFYFRHLSKPPQEGPWCSAVLIGRNKLATIVKVTCTEAGLSEKKTNHSLRATAATALFEANVPEKLIQERTGHRSVHTLWQYQQSTVLQHQATSKILTTNKRLVYQEAAKPISTTVSSHASSIASTLATTSNSRAPFILNIGSLSSCTINISYGSLPTQCTKQAPVLPKLSEKELEELFSDF